MGNLPQSALARAATLVLLAAAMALFLVRGPMGAIFQTGRASTDFSPIYGGARAWLHGGDPYDTRTVQAEFRSGGGGRMPFPSVYPAPLFPLIALFAWLPWTAAKWIWMVTAVLAWAAALWGILKLVPWQPRHRLIPLVWGLLCFPAVMTI